MSETKLIPCPWNCPRPTEIHKMINSADLEAMTPMQLLTFDQQRYVADPYGDLCRAQQRVDIVQRIALFGLAAAIVLLALCL